MSVQILGIDNFFTCIQVLCYEPQVFPGKAKLGVEVDRSAKGEGGYYYSEANEIQAISSDEKIALLSKGLEDIELDLKDIPYWIVNPEKLPLKLLQVNEDKIIRDLWSSLCQSLLKGEYLFIDDYSERLVAVLKLIDAVHEDALIRDFLHPVLSSIYRVCLYLREFCELTKLQISSRSEEKDNIKGRVYSLHRQDIEGSIISGSHFGEQGRSYAKQFENLMLAVVKMTYIDMSGTMRRADIKELRALYDQVCLLERTETGAFAGAGDNFQPVLRGIKAKTSLLIAQAFYKPNRDKGVEPRDLFQEDKCYYNTRSTVLLYKGKCYSHDAAEGSTLYNLLTTRGSQTGDDPHLGDFLNLARNGELYPLWEGKKSNHVSDYKKFLGSSSKFSLCLDLKKHFSLVEDLDTLAKSLKEKEGGGEHQEYKDLMNKIDDLRDVLEEIFRYVRSYSSYIPRGIRVRDISDCLFTVGGEVQVFVASYGTQPIFLDIIEEEVYPRLNLKYKEFSVNLQYLVYLRLIEGINTSNSTVSRVKDLQEDLEKTRKEQEEKQEERLKKQETQYISILGIFAAIIVFVMTTTTIFKEANTLLEFLSVLCAGFGLTALFLFFFKEPENEGGCALLGTIFFALIFSAVFAICDASSSQRESVATEDKADGGINANFSVSYQPGAMEQVPNKADSSARSTIDTIRPTAN